MSRKITSLTAIAALDKAMGVLQQSADMNSPAWVEQFFEEEADADKLALALAGAWRKAADKGETGLLGVALWGTFLCGYALGAEHGWPDENARGPGESQNAGG